MSTGWAAAAAYDRSFARLCAGVVPRLVEAVAAPTGGPAGRSRVLDVGSGTGRLAGALRAAGREVVAVDPEPTMLAFARAAHADVAFVEAGLPDLPIAHGSFDAVVASFVVNHVPRPRDAVAELARVTRRGGSVHVTIWPAAPLSSLNALWQRVVAVAGVEPPAAQRLAPADDFARTTDGLADLLVGAGLRDVRADEVGWTFAIEPDDLWRAVDGGIATIGATYRAQDRAGRAAMQQAFQQLTDVEVLELPMVAIVCSGTA